MDLESLAGTWPTPSEAGRKIAASLHGWRRDEGRWRFGIMLKHRIVTPPDLPETPDGG
jgi:hypothetical protein